MAGYQIGTVCYPDALTANQALASLETGRVVTKGGSAFFTKAQGFEWGMQYIFQNVDTNATVYFNATTILAPCNLMDYADGLKLGWLVAAAWIGTAAILMLRRALSAPVSGE